ncbi:MAG: ATP-binding cassette domain-containing protein [Sediminibacterium sp.]|nr:ATP-binding cassette domain-containing protein [Sediminibacterium sp.]MDP3128227.1 ATP-binding cassette domain-containing protein [Sediminibacterium sp.]
MTIELDHIIPIPLKDRFPQRNSEVWNTSLTFEQGHYIKIKAPSGTGKTTLVHILYKVRHDYEGAVLLNNTAIACLSEDALSELRQQKISILFQDLRLFPNLTARENIELKRILQTPYYEPEMIESMAGALGVLPVLDQKASLCSYGEQQRIAIIRALIQPFTWLLMDEPFSHLDIANTRKAATLIDTECRKRKAGLLITDLDEDDHFNYTKQYHL